MNEASMILICFIFYMMVTFCGLLYVLDKIDEMKKEILEVLKEKREGGRNEG